MFIGLSAVIIGLFAASAAHAGQVELPPIGLPDEKYGGDPWVAPQLSLSSLSIPGLIDPRCKTSQDQLNANLTTENLRLLLERCQPATIDDLIPLLPVRLRSNPLLAFRSQGPEKDYVSTDNPRVVLYSSDATFVLSYIGPHAEERPRLELMEFDREKSRFVLTLIEWDRPRPGKSYVRVRRNPTACLNCHGSDPQPIWNSYPTWPGFYGQDDDRLIRGSDEERAYQTFAEKVAPRVARYGALPLWQVRNERSKLAPSKQYVAKGRVFPYINPPRDGNRLRPNLRYTNALAVLLARRAARILMDDLSLQSKVEQYLQDVPFFATKYDYRFAKYEGQSPAFFARLREEARTERDDFLDLWMFSGRDNLKGDSPYLRPGNLSFTISLASSWFLLQKSIGYIPDNLYFLRAKDRRVSHFFLGLEDFEMDNLLRAAIEERRQMPVSIPPKNDFQYTVPDFPLLKISCDQCHHKDPNRLGPFDSETSLKNLFLQFPWLKEDMLERLRSSEDEILMPSDHVLVEPAIRELEAYIHRVGEPANR